MRTHFKLLSTLTHQQYWEKVVKERDEYKEKQLQSQLFTWDVKIDNLKLYLAQLMEKIEEETGIIVALPHEYDHIMEKGISRFDNEQSHFAKSKLMT